MPGLTERDFRRDDWRSRALKRIGNAAHRVDDGLVHVRWFGHW